MHLLSSKRPFGRCNSSCEGGWVDSEQDLLSTHLGTQLVIEFLDHFWQYQSLILMMALAQH